jgi:molybdopterin converting factor small subunit
MENKVKIISALIQLLKPSLYYDFLNGFVFCIKDNKKYFDYHDICIDIGNFTLSYNIDDDTLIKSYINDDNFTFEKFLKCIEDFYNSLPDEYAKLESGNEVKYVSDNKSLSLNDSGNLEYKNVIYAMKHEVEKEMFEVEIDGKKVTITGDHSLIVFRNNEYISCTVYDIKDGDEIIFL